MKKIPDHIKHQEQLKDILKRFFNDPITTFQAILTSSKSYVTPENVLRDLNKRLKRPPPRDGIEVFEFNVELGQFKVFVTSSKQIEILIPRPLNCLSEERQTILKIRRLIQLIYEIFLKDENTVYFYGPTGTNDKPFNNGIVCQIKNFDEIYINDVKVNKGGITFYLDESKPKFEIVDSFTDNQSCDYLFLGCSISAKDIPLSKEMSDQDIYNLASEICQKKHYLKTLNNQCGFLVSIDGENYYINIFIKYVSYNELSTIPLVAGLIKYLINLHGNCSNASFVMMEENHTALPRSRTEIATEAQKEKPLHFCAIAYLESQEP